MSAILVFYIGKIVTSFKIRFLLREIFSTRFEEDNIFVFDGND